MSLKRKIRKILKGLGVEIDKDKLDEAVEDIDDIFEEQRDEDLLKESKTKESKKKEADSKGKVAKPDSEIEELKAVHKAEIIKVKLDAKIESAISATKAKNAKAVNALLDRDKLELEENGQVKGLKEQLDKIVADNPFLFDSEKDSS